MSKNPIVTSEAGGNVTSLGMPQENAPAPADPVNNDLLQLADALGKEQSGVLPPSKSDIAAKAADVDAKKTALLETAKLVKAGLSVAAAAVCAKHPQLVKVWTEQAIDRIAAAAAKVLLKYNLDGASFMGKYAEELELIMAAGEPLLASYMILKAANQERGGIEIFHGGDATAQQAAAPAP